MTVPILLSLRKILGAPQAVPVRPGIVALPGADPLQPKFTGLRQRGYWGGVSLLSRRPDFIRYDLHPGVLRRQISRPAESATRLLDLTGPEQCQGERGPC